MRDGHVTGVQTCALPISPTCPRTRRRLRTSRPWAEAPAGAPAEGRPPGTPLRTTEPEWRTPGTRRPRSGCSAAPGSPRSGRLPPVRAAHGSGPVRRTLHDLDRKGLTGRRGVIDGLTDLGTLDRAEMRRGLCTR